MLADAAAAAGSRSRAIRRSACGRGSRTISNGKDGDLLIEIGPFTLRALRLLRTVEQRFESLLAVLADVLKNRH
jgi:hypothetical protein